MLHRLHAIATLILALSSAPPAYSQIADAASEKSRPKVTPKSFSELLLATTGEIVLISHNGRWEGTDNDLELRLRRDGTGLIIDYGYGISETRAKYKVNEDGTIIVSPTGMSAWLPMPCSIEKGMLVMRPPGKEQFFAAARKAGIAEAELTDEAYLESYDKWPLRPIDPKKSGVTRVKTTHR